MARRDAGAQSGRKERKMENSEKSPSTAQTQAGEENLGVLGEL